jgi:hypothetical protein
VVGLEENWEALGYPEGTQTSRESQPIHIPSSFVVRP